MKPEDELIDALLKEQARKRDADEDLLSSIESSLDGAQASQDRIPAWKRVVPLSVAAALAMGGVIIYQSRHASAPEMAVHDAATREEGRSNTGVPEEVGLEAFGSVGKLPSEAAGEPMGAFSQARGDMPAERPGAGSVPLGNPAIMVPGRKSMKPQNEVLEKAAAKTELADIAADEAPMLLEDVSPDPLGNVPGGGNTSRAQEAKQKAGEAIASNTATPAPIPVPAAPKDDPVASKPIRGARSTESDAAALPLAGRINVEGATSTRDRVSRREVPLAPAEPKLDGRGGDGGGGSLAKMNRETLRVPLPTPADDIERQTLPASPPEGLNRENYGQLVDQAWKTPWQDPLSTFSIDVDTASYTNIRKMIRQGRSIQRDAVRIEEMVNYFDYRYPAPEGDNPFAAHALLATCPWQPEHLLARVAIKGREIDKNARPASNLIFLIDVSGSMQASDKLPMLKRSMQVLIESLDERDRVGIVVYAGTDGVVLEPTLLDERGKSKAIAALGKLESGGSTNGGAGLARAYKMALNHKVADGVNRVILATDGDFNVGTTGQGDLVKQVKGCAAKGVSMSVLGFGTGNLNDSMLEAITNDGDGNYFYVDCDQEAKRVFSQKLTGTLVTIAKDVKIQVEFNPARVQAYRLIGYANRVLRNRDFNDDEVDAGEIGAGHTVTAFYEVVPVGVASPAVGNVDELEFQRPANREETELVPSDAWLTLKLRYKHPEGVKSRLIKTPVEGEPIKWQDAGKDFRMASAVALFGMKLREMPDVSNVDWSLIRKIAKPALADDLHERRAEFLSLVEEME